MSSSVVCSRAMSSLPPSSRTSLHRVLAINRIEKRRVIQSRSLWWWGRHGSWSSASEHDNVEERLRRQQKIMSYRYSRALRRRAGWDRDNSPPTWLWRGPPRMMSRRWAGKPLSTSESMHAKLKEQESGIPRQDRPWEDFDKDFESFKAAVDKAIEKDPYGYLFGRRLRSPASGDNSLWTLFPRIFNPQEIKKEAASEKNTATNVTKIKIDNLDKHEHGHKLVDQKEASSRSPEDVAPSAKPQPTEEYVYDPVSGRNVPKAQAALNDLTQPKIPFLRSLFFAEHGVDEATPKPKAATSNSKTDRKQDKAFENSRSREYSQLRAATLGTSIDTTATFGGKIKSDIETEEQSPSKRLRTAPEHDDTTPLFSGTTYAELDILQRPNLSEKLESNSTWLQQEGFKQAVKQEGAADTSPGKTSSNRLQSAFDRMHAKNNQPSDKKYITKLQPALDRMEISKPPREMRVSKPAPLDVTRTSVLETSPSSKAPERTQKPSGADMTEDLDLLRASDIRAATKSARVTKQEIEQAKGEARGKLEADYTNRQKAAEASSDMDSARVAVRSSKTATSITSVMKHMQRYPDGIVAKTMRSMGVINENFKKYHKSSGSHVDLTEKLELKPEALEKLPSIYKDVQNRLRASVGNVPSAETVQIEKTKTETTEAIKAAKQETLERQEKENTQIKHLASTINDIYQAHTDLANPTLPNEASAMDNQAENSKQTAIASTHPLQTATVKPGVQRYPEIERHVAVFEPKFIEVREKLKALQKNNVELHTAMVELNSQSTATKGVEQTSAMLKVEQSPSHPKATQVEMSATPSEGSTNAYATLNDHHRLTAMNILNEKLKNAKRNTKDSASTIIPVSQTTAPSLEQPPNTPVTSPYVLLTYNHKSEEVSVTQLNNLMGAWVDTGKANPLAVMSELNYPAAFVMRFAELERTGYTLLGGGGDILVFHKQDSQSTAQKDNAEAFESIKSIKSAISDIRNKIAAEEAQNQPVFPSSNPAKPVKQAATVLDEIPTNIPPPPPSSPAPSTLPLKSKKKSKEGHKVRRQEQVFSGTIRPPTASKPEQTSTPPPPPPPPKTDRPGFFARLYKTTKRIILTVGALGGVAYAIGVITEGLSAHAQHQRAISNGPGDEGVGGPRKKVVVTTSTPTTRPGIFSTESTRD